MIKYKIIAFVNLLLALLFTYLMVFSLMGKPIRFFYPYYGITIILFISAFINCFYSYKLFVSKGKNKNQIFMYLTLIIHSIVWPIIFFTGFFLVTEIIFPISILTFAYLTYLFVIKINKRISFALPIFTIIISIYTIIILFEEPYCLSKGNILDPKSSKFVEVTDEDRKLAPELIGNWDKISLSFREHLRCHATFNLIQAIKDKYLFLK